MNPLFVGMFHEENTLLPVIWMSFALASERFTAKFVSRRSTNDFDHLSVYWAAPETLWVLTITSHA